MPKKAAETETAKIPPKIEESIPRLTAKVSAGAVEEEWISQLKGYDLHLETYTRDCSRLTLRAQDCIADRPPIHLVFHDVSYMAVPLRAHNVRARVATSEEKKQVQLALGENFRMSSVVAFEDRREQTFLIEYGYLQWLVMSQ